MEDVIDENTLVGELSVKQFIKMLQEGIQKGIKQAFAKLHDSKVELESFEKSGKLEQEAQNELEIPTATPRPHALQDHRCDENWGGLYCDEPEIALPAQLKDNFNRAPSNQNWLTVNGGKLSTVCGAVASGMALHFSGGCSRLLVTVDLNLTNAEFIQFYFMYGCLISPNSRNQGVLLEYSVNGGITWTILMEIFYDQFSKPGFVNILLPPDAKEVGTRFRWWQPKHDGLDQNDWAIDNVLISGSADQRTVMLDTFSSAPLPQHERSPADAGPMGRIAFDMFMEDRTT
ncbi:UNVERIFIED_CONTAM: hypothetical protein K2H54_056520, partial [Gekko kuhli]